LIAIAGSRVFSVGIERAVIHHRQARSPSGAPIFIDRNRLSAAPFPRRAPLAVASSRPSAGRFPFPSVLPVSHASRRSTHPTPHWPTRCGWCASAA